MGCRSTWLGWRTRCGHWNRCTVQHMAGTDAGRHRNWQRRHRSGPPAHAACGPAMLGRQACMIEIAALSKRYGTFTAVRSLDLVVPGGELFGFLGPNGAGKTTTMRM